MKNIVLMLGLVMMLGVVVAHDVGYKEKFIETRYYSGDDILKSEVFVNYDNDNRHSTYDYRHGYSYRATRDYFEGKYDVLSRDDVVGIRGSDYWSHENFEFGNAVKYYEYVPYLRGYEERKCYDRPPRDKLFYVKC